MNAFPTHWRILVLAVGWFVAHADVAAQEYDQPPILYRDSTPRNRLTALIDRVAAGEVRLEFEPRFGYLRPLLTELQVPESSQVLVFSKTSLQRRRIAPNQPRALYFSDEIYLGFCQDGEVLEVSAVDPQLGTVFYTVPQEPREAPSFVRQFDNCLICHSSSQTRDVPGQVLRSLYVDSTGEPILSAGTHRVDQTTPLADRWGGWYVSGTHGAQRHLGNLVIPPRQEPRAVDNSAGMNLVELGSRFDTAAYLTPHSDLVALLVLEHQAEAQNLITRAGFLTRQALHYQASLNRELGEPADHVWESTASRLKAAGEPLVEYLLCSGEAQLTHPVRGTSGFAEQFAQPGPRDRQGRSLRELDLNRRLFKYPCSYLVYSASFQQLPGAAKEYALRRIWEVVTARDRSTKFAHLSASDRRAIHEILGETLPDLPAYWQSAAE